jgi:MoxR-like ATPase
MTPQALTAYLDSLVRERIMFSTMIWGPPGIGKSSIVAQTAAAHDLAIIDVRLSQLAPTDLRGLPVAENGMARWYAPEFLPRDGAGILFLDELNLAAPVMQGMAQQLILDRRVGSYVVPEGWFIWAAGNRKEDRAAVFDMPAPLANRFVHLFVEPDFESFKAYALAEGIHEQILAFLAFRPEMLHRLDPQQPAWPSPRSWMMANRLHAAGLDIGAVVGSGTASEFAAYLRLYKRLPDIDQILAGKGDKLQFPSEPSVRYAVVIGLALRAADADQGYNGFRWLTERANTEWTQLFALDVLQTMRAKGPEHLARFRTFTKDDAKLKKFFDSYAATFPALAVRP